MQLESMQQKCDAWREEVERMRPLRDEVAQLHQEKARLQQELAQASEHSTGLAQQLQETNAMMKVTSTIFIVIMQFVYVVRMQSNFLHVLHRVEFPVGVGVHTAEM